MSAAESGPSVTGDDELKYAADPGDGGYEFKAHESEAKATAKTSKVDKGPSFFWCNRKEEVGGTLHYLEHMHSHLKTLEESPLFYARQYCADFGMPAVSGRNPEVLHCSRLLAAHRKKFPTHSFSKAVRGVYRHLEEVFDESRRKLKRILADDGISAEAASKMVAEMVDNNQFDTARIMQLIVSRRPTAKEMHVFSTVFLQKLGASFTIFNLDSRRVLDVEKFAALFHNEDIENIVRKKNAKKTAGIKMAAQTLAFEAAGHRFVANAGEHSEVFPMLCRKAMAAGQVLSAATFHAGVLKDPGIEKELIAKLCGYVRSGEDKDVKFAKRYAEAVCYPSVYLAVAKCAQQMSDDLHKEEAVAKGLLEDIKGAANLKAFDKLTKLKSTPAHLRSKSRQPKAPCTDEATLKVTDACAIGVWDATAQYDANAYAIELINDAHLVQNAFAAKILRECIASEALSKGLLKYGPVKDIERLREKIQDADDSMFPKSGSIIDLVRCSLRFDGCDDLFNAVIAFMHATKPKDDSNPMRAGEVRLSQVRIKNLFEGLRSDRPPTRFCDVKINVKITIEVGGRLISIIGEVQMYANGMGLFKAKSHGFYSVTRTADAWQMAQAMAADFCFADLRDVALMTLLTDAGFTETDAKRRHKALEAVAFRSSVPLPIFEAVCGWYVGSAFSEVSDDFLDRVLRAKADRWDLAETLDFLKEKMSAAGKWKAAFVCTSCDWAPVLRYVEEARDFKPEIADRLLPSPLPAADSSWPIKEGTAYTPLLVAAAACARFPATTKRVEYCQKLPSKKAPAIESPFGEPVEVYTANGGKNKHIEEALRAAYAD